ncbi:MAG: phosphatidylglycerophosphatase A [Planctomycetota bacterium]
MDRLTRFVGSFFGLGLIPFAHGTWGTLGAMAIVLVLPADPVYAWTIPTMVLFLLACGFCIVLGDHAEQEMGLKDPGFIVLDEVAGYLVAVASVTKPGLPWIVMAFVVFRIFDILKPWPCRRLEKIKGGKGILYDDLMAGFYTFLVLLLSRELTGWPT